MMIKGNLLSEARPSSALPLALGLWLFATGMGGAAAYFLLDAADLRDERPRLEARLSRLQELARHASGETMLPTRPELEAMRQRVQTLNALTDVRGLSTSELLSWFEQRLPGDARLVSLRHRASDGETLLIAEASATEPLATLLRELEKEPRFAEVLLAKQGTRNVQGRVGAVQFEIRIRHRS